MQMTKQANRNRNSKMIKMCKLKIEMMRCKSQDFQRILASTIAAGHETIEFLSKRNTLTPQRINVSKRWQRNQCDNRKNKNNHNNCLKYSKSIKESPLGSYQAVQETTSSKWVVVLWIWASIKSTHQTILSTRAATCSRALSLMVSPIKIMNSRNHPKKASNQNLKLLVQQVTSDFWTW